MKTGNFKLFSDAFPYPVNLVAIEFTIYCGRPPQCKHSALSVKIS